ncbi:MAG TPA: hypothetical protein P5523_08410 [Bacteroidales bacterium]|nr:hypothetical protein [Bacteroidales bacterium]
MGTLGRYYSPRDMKLIHSFNAELMGDIVQTLVVIHKLVPEQTLVNIYGESSPTTGKVFYPGVPITAFVKRETIDTPADEFGTDRKQVVKFAFREEMLKEVNLYPENGDIIVFNERYHEIDGVDQEQFPGGIPEKSLSIVCNTHYSRLSKLSLFERQG